MNLFRAGRLLSCLLLSFAVPSALPAQSQGRIAFERFTLSNGLEVILAPDRSGQVATVDLWYLTGSRDEPPGKGGLARLFNRLLFMGSTNVPAGAHVALIQEAGGRVDVGVEEDVSRFIETVPSNRLNQALWLEADRMRGVVVNDTTVSQSRFELLQDLQNRAQGEPYTGLVVDAVASLYDTASCAGYSHPPLGRPASVVTLTTKDAADFLNQHFRPNAARLVVSGDFDPTEVRQTVTNYFGGIARGPSPQSFSCTPGFSPGPRKKTIPDRLPARPAAGWFYRIPAHNHADTPALELLGVVLGQGQNARLSQQLVRTAAVASAVQGGILGTRQGPGAFGIFAVAGPGVRGDSLSALLAAEARWASEGITQADLERARNVYLATWVSERERPQDIAEALQHAATFHGSPDAVNSEVDAIKAVTLTDLRRVAGAWLKPENAVALVITAGGAS